MKKLLFVFGLAGAACLMLVAPNAHGQTPPPVPTIGGPTGGPPPPPGSNPTATATATPAPTATPTQVPLTLRVSLAHGSVRVGQGQKVSVATLPGATVSLTVNFPNGQKYAVQGSASDSGNMTFSYPQPSGTTKGNNRTVKVGVGATLAGQSKHATKKYSIA